MPTGAGFASGLITAGLIAGAWAPTVVLAQDVVVVSSVPSCPECRIELIPVGRIADRDEDPWLGDEFTVSVGPDDRMYSTSFSASPGVVSVLDPNGDRVASFGREGEGPGEGSWVRAPMFGPGDTAYVYDMRLGRMTLWTLEGEFVRTFRVPDRLLGWTVMGSGQFVCGGS